MSLDMKLGPIISRLFNRNADAEPDVNANAKKIAFMALSVVLVELCVIMMLKTTDKMPRSAMGIDKTIGQLGHTADDLDLEVGPYGLEALPGPSKPKKAKKLGEELDDTAGKEPVSSGLIISGKYGIQSSETLLPAWDTIGQNLELLDMINPPGHQDWQSPYQPLQN
jgi:hypothetical protein